MTTGHRELVSFVSTMPTRRGVPFDVDQLRADVTHGRPFVSIADEYDCHPITVTRACRAYGIERPRRRVPARHPELGDAGWLHLEYVVAGRSLNSIAKQFGVSQPTVRDAIDRAGIEARPRATDTMPDELNDREWLTAAHLEHSTEAIARHLGVGATSVRRALRRHGIGTDPHRDH